MTRAIALRLTGDYSGAMPRLLRLLLLLALMLMPVGLLPGGHAGEANAAVAAETGHSAGTSHQAPAAPLHHPGDRAADCAMACSALPSVGGTLDPPCPAAIIPDPRPLATGHGLAPEAATPPPRSS